MKKLSYMALGAVLALSITALCTTAFAALSGKTIEVFTGVSIVIDGAELSPTDANGTAVEPFIYNGTTYLPVRAISESLNKSVTWDGATSTVYLGGNDVTYLDEMAAVYETTTDGAGGFNSVGEITPIYKGDTFDRGVDIRTNSLGWQKDGFVETTTLTYILDGSYDEFITTLRAYDDYYCENGTVITVKGDGKTLYVSPSLSRDSLSVDISVDIENVESLEIELVTNTGGTATSINSSGRNILLANARIIK